MKICRQKRRRCRKWKKERKHRGDADRHTHTCNGNGTSNFYIFFSVTWIKLPTSFKCLVIITEKRKKIIYRILWLCVDLIDESERIKNEIFNMKQQQQWQWQWHQQQSTHSPGYGDHKRSRQTNNSKNNNNNDKQTLRKKIKRWKRKTADKKKSESRMCTEMTFHFLFQPSPKKVRGFPTTITTASLSQASKRIFLLQNIVAHTKVHTQYF